MYIKVDNYLCIGSMLQAAVESTLVRHEADSSLVHSQMRLVQVVENFSLSLFQFVVRYQQVPSVMISSGVAPDCLRGSSGTCSECCLHHHRASYRVTHGCNIKLRAAFSSLSRWAPQLSQWYVLTFGGMASFTCPQDEHRFVLGKYLGAFMWCTVLYEIWNKMSPMRELL